MGLVIKIPKKIGFLVRFQNSMEMAKNHGIQLPLYIFHPPSHLCSRYYLYLEIDVEMDIKMNILYVLHSTVKHKKQP